MSSKKILKLLIALIILIIIIIISILIVLHKRSTSPEYSATPSVEDEVQILATLERVSVRNNYYMVQTCVNKFYLYYINAFNAGSDIKIIDEEAKASIEEEKRENINAIYSMLDPQYIEYKGINSDNILSKLQKISDVEIYIDDMYVIQKNENIYTYFVYAKLRNKSSNEVSDISLIVNVDAKNRAFKILLDDYVKEKYPSIEVGTQLEINVDSTITANEYNKYSFEHITDEEYILDIFDIYKNNTILYRERLYNNLNEEYKNKRFPEFDKFNEYIKERTKDNVTMELSGWQKNKYDNYTQYICVDSNNRYVIIKEIAPMKYTLILDTHTIDTPQFLEQYNEANSMEKVGYNIQRCLDAINDKDYLYVYNKLDEEFKSNNYKTESSFEKEIKDKLFDSNKVSKVSSSNEGDTYIYNITVTDAENENSNQDMTIIMQLKEGTDFVMSFSFV